MNSNTILKGAFVAFCLVGMLVLPAAAAPAGQGTTGNAIDQGLKDDLWANHHQYRLQEFDLNVQRANSVISILDKYSIDTTQVQATLTTITSERAALDTALTNKDTAGLRTINADLQSLWKQFAQETKDSVKTHYTAARAAAKASRTGSANNPANITSARLGLATV